MRNLDKRIKILKHVFNNSLLLEAGKSAALLSLLIILCQCSLQPPPPSEQKIQQVINEQLAHATDQPDRDRYQLFHVEGISMKGVYEPDDYVLIRKLRKEDTPNINRKDVVVFRPVERDVRFGIKRVVGLPGEHVRIKNGKLVVSRTNDSDEIVHESDHQVPEHVENPDYRDTALESDEYFLLGDNRKHSFDSRFWGPISVERIKGVVVHTFSQSEE